MQELVSAEWLRGEIGAPDLVVFDATYYLPNEPQDARALFAQAHVPGARFFDVNEVADPETNLPHMAPTPGRAERLLGQLGIGNDSRVVFYDQKGLFSAARGWWLLRLFGHEKVAVLDGGLPKWREAGAPLESGEAPAPAPRHFWADFVARRLAGIGDVKRVVADRSAQIIDARSTGRFDGTAPEPRPGLPSGHMPGACSVPATALLAPDQTMLPPEQLRALFAKAGVDGSKPLITSCGTGITACVVALGLVHAGLPEPAVYDGSWTEWAARPETAKETSA
ncbi:sulfurtransferase [Pseudoroseomonas wenyumeiae]|uniref:3-mercaptopyruvate sulfurtransferase n=1 Tax=Teichococcus wenyumeiae TaxID=2478470 RepID=A0A3A9JBE1_9PROT|nr:rhodanese-like domain-containing protein [Pseudoroseomonas wenyumeiae]RKK03802.1 sulfurtransferase [Pseudoroseomonas wenyumeiae]RMI24713.1 sulfurtransferase [Pseudoroseomonas wenyumeiae]